jgi:16S rRNA processing protein RimM
MADSDWVTVGRVRTVFGVKGWLKVESFTEPPENLLDYQDWRLKNSKGKNSPIALVLDGIEQRQNDILIHIDGIDNREDARIYANHLIQVQKTELPMLEDDEFYWHELEGLNVFQIDDSGRKQFKVGVVDSLLDTGANDVLLVKPDQATQKDTEVLIPYLPEQVVKNIDLAKGEMLVDWYYDE